MGTENLESSDPRLPSSTEQALLDARALVNRMVAAVDWPHPDLLQQIVDAGDAAVEPLVELLRAMPRESLKLAPLSHAIGLLSDLRRPETIPELVKVVEGYHDEACMVAADALSEFGPTGFDALIDLCSKPTISGFQIAFVMDAAAAAAGHDSKRKSRFADIARPMLEQLIAEAREELKSTGFLERHTPDDDLDDDDLDEPDEDLVQDLLADEEDDLEVDSDENILASGADSETDDWDEEEDDDDEEVIKPFIAEKVAMMVDALAAIADPLARDTIMTAFDEGLIDESIVTREIVDDHYAKAAESPEEEPDFVWLDAYREDYAAHIELPRTAAPTPSPRSKYRYEDRYDEGDPPPDIPATAPIRNPEPMLGRNDLCWCGSGKKYKKCHLGKQTTD